MPWFGDALLYALWTALPLALTAAIALLDTRRTAHRRAEQPTDVADGSASRPPATDAPDAGSEEGRPDDGELEHRRNRLISHLRGLRIQRKQLQDTIIALRSEETHAVAIRANVELNEMAIDERTRAHLQSLPQTVRDGFLCYLQGLEQALADPTVTAHLHEAAATYMSRYEEAAEAKLNEYLVYLDDHPLLPPAGVGSAGGR